MYIKSNLSQAMSKHKMWHSGEFLDRDSLISPASAMHN